MFHTLIKHGFLTNQSAQGRIYILIADDLFHYHVYEWVFKEV